MSTRADGTERISSGSGLRELSLAEVAPLLAETGDAFLPAASEPEATIYHLLAHFQAEPNFSIVGYSFDNQPASYIFTYTDQHKGIMTLGPMYVGEEHRREGLGRQQVEDFIQLARVNGLATVYTRTWGNNAASRHIFDSLGFEVREVTPADRIDGDDTLHYWLDL